jgi:glycosyltransferase involved in cell wall biosynthesis
MTAAGWAPEGRYREDRAEIRRELGLPEEAVVFGLVGSLIWNRHVEYCYGSELVRAIREVRREDIRVLIAGDGTGASVLREMAGPDLGARVIMLGRIPRERVPGVVSAIDVGSLPQSVDGVGSFRLTTKLSEYLEAGVPIVTGQVPLAYDLDEGYIWRLPGDAPWDPVYLRALRALLEGVDHAQVAERRAAVPAAPQLFQRAPQQRRMAEFLRDVQGAGGRR